MGNSRWDPKRVPEQVKRTASNDTTQDWLMDTFMKTALIVDEGLDSDTAAQVVEAKTGHGPRWTP